MNNQVFERKWSDYYQAVEGRPPRETLLMALEKFEEPQFAVDLGCGDGRDTVELLKQGWRVLGIDGEAEAIARLQSRPNIDLNRLETRVMHFENLVLPEAVDLINASFCLPFCPPEHFSKLWNKIVSALRVGGRFCGQLFGDRDSWATYPNMSHHIRAQVEELLQPFTVEVLQEEKHPGITALGEQKHWHIFHIVACKESINSNHDI
ncbi:class I SAM-dependent methyltransferase [Gloeocapsopsis crepidinum LEGE 06123]|uniref:Class I SAM-dependent methyltransferase n=1 Tax=Gloeocapsopsis crepidinum LEGE 06123 TaxID=588587 RepID=A0ABR9UU56_9CHRO|nr:class I SAM-dependent methyltransferase [Gloeocapsopsis crepidinum]MBE9191838.1 class I SAM-dependent methyltransferase [Gloeocapsopsis crepidinum LEGE 06123]